MKIAGRKSILCMARIRIITKCWPLQASISREIRSKHAGLARMHGENREDAAEQNLKTTSLYLGAVFRTVLLGT